MVRHRGSFRILGALLAVVVAAALAACGGDDDDSSAAAAGGEGTGAGATAEAPDTVRIGTFFSAVDYAPFYVARSEGYFDDAAGAAKVEYTEFDSAPAVTEALATGRIDMVFMAEPPALIAAAAGVGVEISALGASLVQDIVVPPDSDIATAADLEGKRVGVLYGTSSHYGVIKIAEDAGVDPDAIELVDLAPPDAQVAFESGDIDAWAVWPPFVQQQLVQGTGELLPEGDAAIQSIVVTRSDFADDHPDVADALLGAVDDAKAFIADHAADAQAIVADEVGVDPEVVELSWDRHDFSARLDQDVVDDIQAKADFLLDAGFLDEEVDVAAITRLDG
jgi:sulfonate transport system substrate-binding protein